jgi:hypothetical protein
VTQAVAAAGSLKEVQAAHDTFLSDASGVAFTASQQATKLLKAALCCLLSLVWEFSLTAPADEAQVRYRAKFPLLAHHSTLSPLHCPRQVLTTLSKQCQFKLQQISFDRQLPFHAG